MKFTVEDRSAVKKTVHVEIPEDVVSSELDKAYKELKKNAKVKGFRPGKAPRSVLERMYRQDVHMDVTQKLIQDSVFKAIQDAELNIVAAPKIDPPELEVNKPYLYDADVEIQPTIDDIDFKGLSLTKTMYEAGDKEVDAQLKMVQKNFATQTPVEEERGALEGDFVLIDYEGFKDGNPYSETEKTENFTLKIGDATIAKEFDDALMGMKSGDNKEFSVTFPEDYFNERLANLTISFQVTLNEIREEVLPEIDDELAKKIGQYESLDEVKKLIRENVQQGYDRRIDQEMNEQIFSALIEKTDFEVPDAMIEMELDGIIQETEQSLSYQNMSMEDIGMTRESISEKYREVAEKQVRRHLILSKIINQEKIELTDEDLEKAYSEMAENVKQPVEEIKKFYGQSPDKLEFFKHTLLEKQALSLIIDNSTVNEVKPEVEDSAEQTA